MTRRVPAPGGQSERESHPYSVVPSALDPTTTKKELVYLIGTKSRAASWAMIHVDGSFETVGHHKRVVFFPFTLEDLRVAFAVFRIFPTFKRAAIQMRAKVERFIPRLQDKLILVHDTKSFESTYGANAKTIAICDWNTRVHRILRGSRPNFVQSRLGSQHIRMRARF